MKKIIIVGAGFGGLNAARSLGGKRNIEVLLIDRRNHHLFQPLLYQVATAGLSPADIAVPIRSEMSLYSNIEVHLGNVEQINLAKKTVHMGKQELNYDYLILACGAKHSYFGHSDWEEFAPGLKTLEGATEIRRRILMAFEMAENEIDPVIQQQYLNFVVIGGGPTGVELAGALAEISHQILIKDFRRIDPHKTQIILVEAGSRVLSMFSESLSARAEKDLAGLGVQIRKNSRVTEVSGKGVKIGAESLDAKTVIWAAGVQPSSLGKNLGTELDPMGRVVVGPDLSLKDHPEVFVIGDQAHFNLANGKSLPGLAPVAIQQGIMAAQNILRETVGQPRKAFRYFDKGQMATIGKRKAVMEVGNLKVGGGLAWLAWLFIHIYFLVGFRNRVAVIAEWAWSYLFSKRSARLIVQKTWRSYEL